MRQARIMRVVCPSLALLALAVTLVLAGPAVAAPSPVATPSLRPTAVAATHGAEVRAGEDVIVPRGETVQSAVAFGGDIVVEGRVVDAVVAFGGDIRIDGEVGTSVVAFGGDVTIGPGADIGRRLGSTDTAVVLFGGALTQAPGAQVHGQTQSFEGFDVGSASAWAARRAFVNPLSGLSFFGWLVQTAFCLVLALVVAALMPRQLRAVQAHLARSPWASLGWGALAFFIAVPAIMIVLIISVIGLLLVVPYALFVLLAYFFVTTGVAAFLAQKVITGFGGRENLMLAVALGVIGTTVVSRIPVAGPVLMAAMTVFGAGAALLAFSEWRRLRRETERARAAAGAPGSGPYPVSATAASRSKRSLDAMPGRNSVRRTPTISSRVTP